ncbi:hypothetical protein EJ08DRAFT_706483 [Tothia fuscella]|uniref:Uncharacterized protein n=1 Tax=Tothia fuscella TaxID=1048955 RepID=A0A9P4NFN9_9PEZI|nr:hypothetical protein EJ08DRAFT_706483 [Tothia fuscella]
MGFPSFEPIPKIFEDTGKPSSNESPKVMSGRARRFQCLRRTSTTVLGSSKAVVDRRIHNIVDVSGAIGYHGAPSVTTQHIIDMGATVFRKVLESQTKELQGVVLAYSKAFDLVYYLGAAGGVITIVFA